MIFPDSWIWLEFFQEDEKAGKAEQVLEKIEKEGAVISPTVLMEVRYRVANKYSSRKADRVTSHITSFDELKVMPVNEEVALYAADLRQRYYSRNERQLSYADAIHIATAAMTDCEKLYTGDPDFKEIEEVETEII